MKGLALPIPHTRTALPPRLHRMIEWITGEFSWLERLEFCSALIAAAVKQGATTPAIVGGHVGTGAAPTTTGTMNKRHFSAAQRNKLSAAAKARWATKRATVQGNGPRTPIVTETGQPAPTAIVGKRTRSRKTAEKAMTAAAGAGI
jgi:hypothetical protein